ncbi:unnamed protein product [Leptidea sinapis]|uniref:TIL domain-containing protein n=1 Tax=Leptidea sinapis TaxID=189913 RepID=A0A5E4QC91_9NEOP|nr:unnamed protein product [Leptidea sinapis]
MYHYKLVCAVEMKLACLLTILCLLKHGSTIMIKQECPHNELYRSCSFTNEYTCWESQLQDTRVMTIPERLTHCRSGCYCKKGEVRAYPDGPCVPSGYCRDQRLSYVFNKLPYQLVDF